MIFKKKEKEKTPKEILEAFSKLEKKVQSLESLVEELRKENKKATQKVGLTRFNPFSNTGGDQSFSVALLDGENNGVLITSFYSNERSSVYGKPIEKGKSKYALCEEEKKAIEKAMNGNVPVNKNKKENKKRVAKNRKTK